MPRGIGRSLPGSLFSSTAIVAPFRRFAATAATPPKAVQRCASRLRPLPATPFISIRLEEGGDFASASKDERSSLVAGAADIVGDSGAQASMFAAPRSGSGTQNFRRRLLS